MKSVLIPANVQDLLIARLEITGDTAHVSLTTQAIHMELLALQVSHIKVGYFDLKLHM